MTSNIHGVPNNLTNRAFRPETLSVDGGLIIDPITRAIAPNISMSVNYALAPDAGSFSAAAIGDLTTLPYLYARWTNPTARQLELRMASIEGTEDAVSTATGIAAIAAACFTFLRSGDHAIVSDVCYPGANELTRRLLPEYGIEVTAVNTSNIDEVKNALRSNTKLLLCESPCNPILRLSDIRALSTLTRDNGTLLVVDSTLATPVATRPIELGADLIIHSLTKYINGHGDALGGIVCGRKDLVEAIRSRAGVYLGASLSAHSAWLIMRGIDTLYPRVRTISDSAGKIASFLAKHPQVRSVIYPGLETHPQHDLARRQMAVFGGMLTFQVDNPQATARQLSENTRLVHYAVSLGHQRSLVAFLGTEDMNTATYELKGTQLSDYVSFAGDGVFRMSVGLESVEDIIEDLDNALRT